MTAFPSYKLPPREEGDDDFSDMPMKTLLKRGAYVKQPVMTALQKRMEEDRFGVMVLALDEDSAMSGPGDEAGYLIFIYYEPKDERAVLRGAKAAGLNLEAHPAHPVDPETCEEEEYYFIYYPGNLCYVSMETYKLCAPPEGCEDEPDNPYWVADPDP